MDIKFKFYNIMTSFLPHLEKTVMIENAVLGESANIISDAMRATNITKMLMSAVEYNQSSSDVIGLMSLDFTKSSQMMNGIKVMIGVAVLLTIALTIWNFLRLNTESDVSQSQVAELFKRTMYTSFLIVMFPTIFSMFNNIAENFTTGATTIGVEDYTVNSLVSFEQIFSEPFFYDLDPEAEPYIVVKEDGQKYLKLDINERCTRNTDKGCKEPTAGILGVGKTEYYRFIYDYTKILFMLEAFKIMNYIVTISVFTRAFKVGILYLWTPLTTALRGLDGLRGISTKVSSELYAGVAQIGIQIFVMRVVAILATEVLPVLMPKQYSGIVAIIGSVVAFFIVIFTPMFVKKIIGSGLDIVPKINLKVPSV